MTSVHMEIVLARHGRPKLDQWSWVTPRQLAGWIRAYNDGGVFEDAPTVVRAKAAQSGWTVSSPLLRCAESARALVPSRDISTEEVLREAGLPHSSWGFPRLPVAVWMGVFRAAWFYGYSANSESLIVAENRARIAAKSLITLAGEHQSVFVMGHGIMTALIARQLTHSGWSGPKRPAHGYWQFSVYRKDEE
jgi:broad specificity phosphatase PhoE